MAGLRREWNEVRAHVRAIPAPRLPSPKALRRNWEELKQAAAAQKRSVFEMSSLLALAAVSRLPENLLWLSRCAQSATRRTGRFFAGALLDHYHGALQEIRRTGYLAYWAREFRPYLRAAAAQFSPRRRSSTQRLLRRASSRRSTK